MKRILCVWLPRWPIQRLCRGEGGPNPPPLALYASGAGGNVLITACSLSAVRRGVVPGMPFAETRALTEQTRGAPLRFALHEPLADRETLRRLAVWCRRFSPLVSLEQTESPDSLLLDITGCAHLFGGEETLARKVVEDLRSCGLQAVVAVADTVGASWAVAHAGVVQPALFQVVPPGRQIEALRPLAVEALRLSPPVLALLREFDLRQIGQLLALPRAELAFRIQGEVTHRLDQALGEVPELHNPEQADEPIEASWEFEYPVGDGRVIESVFQQLLEQVCARLQPRQLGIQSLLCSLRTTAGQQVPISVGLLRPSAASAHLLELARLQFERIRLPAEVSVITVRVAVAVPMEFHQAQLLDDDSDCWQQFPALVERLSNRLGEKAVLRARLWPDAQPELAYRCVPWLREDPGGTPFQPFFPTLSLTNRQALSRPPCLRSRPAALPVVAAVPGGLPVRFPWQGHDHQVAQWWGPERIETGWWRGHDVRRDYYRVETTSGKRFWLFRTIEDDSWFLHGTFG